MTTVSKSRVKEERRFSSVSCFRLEGDSPPGFLSCSRPAEIALMLHETSGPRLQRLPENHARISTSTEGICQD